MRKAKMTTRLRELFAREGAIRIVGAHNPLGAKVAERAGFDGVWSSGLEISTSFAVPDANILTMSQYLAVAADMADAVNIPVVADCDTGYGNSNNVIHMVRKYEAAGIAAVCIEDKFFPKVNSFVPGRQDLAPIGEFVGKILAAKNAQTDPDFMVFARVEAFIAGWGLEEALKRAHAYRKAGADAILMHSKSKEPNEIQSFFDRWDADIPVVVVPTTYSGVTADELHSMGAKLIIYANHGLRAGIRAMEGVFSEILEKGTTRPIEDRIVPMKEVFEIQGMMEMKKDEEIYMRTQRGRARAIIPAAGDHLNVQSMKDIAADIPMTMLDVNGKPLLQRQYETLNQSSISQVTVVNGYKEEAVVVDGVKMVSNKNWESTGEVESILCGAQDEFDGATLVAYSDILFDGDVVDRLMKSESPITILTDSSYDPEKYDADRRTDLVIMDAPPSTGRRSLGAAGGVPVQKIGGTLPPKEASAEFAGLALFTQEGFKNLVDVFNEVKGGSGAFHEAENPAKASLTDLLQELIDRGSKVTAVSVTQGWMEIHSFEDYKLACQNVPV